MKIIFATLLFRLTKGITTFMVPGALPAVVEPWKRKVLPSGCLFGQWGDQRQLDTAGETAVPEKRRAWDVLQT